MQFHNYNEINLNLFDLNVPIFNSNYNIFISKILNNNIQKIDNNDIVNDINNTINIKSDSLRLLNFKDDVLQTEFLYSSNDFYKFINSLDVQFKNEIIKKGTEWFGNNLNSDTVNNIFKQSVILPDKLPGLPTVNFKWDDTCKISSNKKKKLSKNDLKQNMEIELDFIVEGIYFYKNRCHLVFNVKHIKILNDVCQSFESLFEDNDNSNNDHDNENDNNNGDIDSETIDITASTFFKYAFEK
mgnify:CR=1 FL=1